LLLHIFRALCHVRNTNMSRTTRKRKFSFYNEYEWWFKPNLWDLYYWDDEYDSELIRYRDLYYTESYGSYSGSPDKPFRKAVNNVRRNHDKRELYKELNLKDYEGLYDPWNCKTANAWWYW